MAPCPRSRDNQWSSHPPPSCAAQHYILLSEIPVATAWLAVLDLKDAFLCTLRHPGTISVWHWGARQWISVNLDSITPGFRHSSLLCGQILAKDLAEFKNRSSVTTLWYVDDSSMYYHPGRISNDLYRASSYLAKRGFKVSKKQVQLCQPQVQYLELQLSQGIHRLLEERIAPMGW